MFLSTSNLKEYAGREMMEREVQNGRSEFVFKIATRMKNQILLDLKNIKKNSTPPHPRALRAKLNVYYG